MIAGFKRFIADTGEAQFPKEIQIVQSRTRTVLKYGMKPLFHSVFMDIDFAGGNPGPCFQIFHQLTMYFRGLGIAQGKER